MQSHNPSTSNAQEAAIGGKKPLAPWPPGPWPPGPLAPWPPDTARGFFVQEETLMWPLHMDSGRQVVGEEEKALLKFFSGRPVEMSACHWPTLYMVYVHAHMGHQITVR